MSKKTLITAIGENERVVGRYIPGEGRRLPDRIGGEALPAKDAFAGLAECEPLVSLAVGQDRQAEQLQWLANLHGDDPIFERGVLHQTVCSISDPSEGGRRVASTPRLRKAELIRRLAIRMAGCQRVVILPTPDGSHGFAEAVLQAARMAAVSTTLCLSREQVQDRAEALALGSQAGTVQLSAEALAHLRGPSASGSVACDIASIRALGWRDVIATRGGDGAIAFLDREWVSVPGRMAPENHVDAGRPAFAGAAAAAMQLGLSPLRVLELAYSAGTLAVAGERWEGVEELDRAARRLERTPLVIESQPEGRLGGWSRVGVAATAVSASLLWLGLS
ncbi:hypothetical protein MalM25_33200 [Planctomycetes bacterium MalM25]|nr:hypothetical protein MalM25_33200 [Planctomycetes bacterium MalM25]